MEIAVTLKLLGMRGFEVREAKLDVMLPPGSTLEDAFLQIEVRNPGFCGAVLDGAGGIAKSFAVLLNGDNVALKEGVRTRLSVGDALFIIPAVSGG